MNTIAGFSTPQGGSCPPIVEVDTCPLKKFPGTYVPVKKGSTSIRKESRPGTEASGALCVRCVTNERAKARAKERNLLPYGYVCRCAYRGNYYNVLNDPEPPVRVPKTKEKHTSRSRTTEKPGCARAATLRRKAQKIVRLLRVDQSLRASSKLPNDFSCGSLRSKIRSMYSSEGLTPVQELSIKTATKAETQPCDYCEGLSKSKIDQWKKARLQPVEVDENHLSRFSRAFRGNVPSGWNVKSKLFPYVPNGNGSLSNPRREGGNWNSDAFSEDFRAELVYSAGKPRIVTLYSSHNVSILTPLHDALYSHLKGRKWVLVGDPTDEDLRGVAEGCAGDEWLSFDYKQATDQIKTAYVQRAVEILQEQAVGLSDEEVRCLDVLKGMRLDGSSAGTGQPMGSPMSFPLLCLINKAVVDLALTQLMLEGKIRFKEWTVHRCLINGDDLLTKSTSSGDLVDAIVREGRQVGLETNLEKTMRSSEWAEVNSTAFRNGVLQKKTNVSALWMGADVPDVLGFAKESTISTRGFRAVLANNVTRLARQKIKTCVWLPPPWVGVVMSTKRFRAALGAVPSREVKQPTNLFPVVVMPDGYDLSREEEAEVLSCEVEKVKAMGRWRDRPVELDRLKKDRRSVVPIAGTPMSRRAMLRVLRPKKTMSQRTVLRCFSDSWYRKRREALRADVEPLEPVEMVSDLSGVGRLVDAIKAWRIKRTNETGDRPKEPPGRPPDPLGDQCDFVSLSDD